MGKPPETEKIKVIEDGWGNTITMSHGRITIASTGVLELKPSTVIVNGRVLQASNDPIK